MKPIFGELPIGVRQDVIAVNGHRVTVVVEAIDEVKTAYTAVNQHHQYTHKCPLTSQENHPIAKFGVDDTINHALCKTVSENGTSRIESGTSHVGQF